MLVIEIVFIILTNHVYFCSYGNNHISSYESYPGNTYLNSQHLTIGAECGVPNRQSEESKNKMIKEFNQFRSNVNSSALSFMVRYILHKFK